MNKLLKKKIEYKINKILYQNNIISLKQYLEVEKDNN